MADRRVRQVTFIPSIKSIEDGYAFRKKVAAYARVSTGSDEQETSLEAQRDYYEKYIQSRNDWIFVDVYYDDGISGLSYRNREGFNRMVDDALTGRIDLILTKSLSRFARNTVDTLVIIRKLKEKGVGVYFEKEDINTLDAKGEFLITLMSSLAQEESRSISENVAWGCRKRFADGKYSVPYSNFLGYDRGPDGKPMINEEEAKKVRFLYWLYLIGFTEHNIRSIMVEQGISFNSKAGVRWHTSVICRILRNEKYKGDALLQKGFTVDFLTKRRKRNEGELPQYYLEKAHPAIVSDEVFDMVQTEIARRAKFNKSYSSMRPFSSKIVCSSCGSFYGRKSAHKSTEQVRYYYEFWRCNRYYENQCSTAKIRKEILQRYYRFALAGLIDLYQEVESVCARVANEVLQKDVGDQIRKVIENIKNIDVSIYHYSIFQRHCTEEIRVIGIENLVIAFIDGSKFEYPLHKNKLGTII